MDVSRQCLLYGTIRRIPGFYCWGLLLIVMNNPSSLAVPDRINNILALGYLSLGGDFENLF